MRATDFFYSMPRGLLGQSFSLHQGSSAWDFIVDYSHFVKSASAGQRACLSRRVVFFLMNPGLQPYLTRPQLKSMREFSYSSRHTSGLTLKPLLFIWVCAKPQSGQRERLNGRQPSTSRQIPALYNLSNEEKPQVHPHSDPSSHRQK